MLHVHAYLREIVERGTRIAPAEPREVVRINQSLDVGERLVGLFFDLPPLRNLFFLFTVSLMTRSLA